MTPAALGSIVIEQSVWQNLPLFLVMLAGALYWLGGRSFRSARRLGTLSARRVWIERWRGLAFLAALTLTVFALQQPMDSWADRLFWVHMVQHVLLLMAVAPLLVLGAPWMRMWRGFPLRMRRRVARWVVRSPSAGPLRVLARFLGRPAAAWWLLALDVLLWHLPSAYDLTLRSDAVHYTEHATFVLFGVLGWAQLFDSPPFHARLDPLRRAGFALSQMAVGWALALALSFASRPWYSAYADLHHAGGLSPIDDQHLAAGVMWVPASIPWSVLLFVLLYRWIAGQDGVPSEPPSEPVRSRPAPSGPLPSGPVPAPVDDPVPLPPVADSVPAVPVAMVGSDS